MRDPRNVTILVLSVALALSVGWLLGRGPEPAWAQSAPSNYAGGTVSGNNRMIAATGSVGSGMSVLWLIDTKANRLVVYGTGNLGKNVELRAARNIEWDLKLDEYHDDSQYRPEDLERLWRKQHKLEPEKAGDKKDGGSEDSGK